MTIRPAQSHAGRAACRYGTPGYQLGWVTVAGRLEYAAASVRGTAAHWTTAGPGQPRRAARIRGPRGRSRPSCPIEAWAILDPWIRFPMLPVVRSRPKPFPGVSESHMNAGDSLFDGVRVGAFESRRADEMARMIERFGGVPHVSPSMREVPLAENPQAVDFAHRLLTGEIAAVVFLTGVGFRLLLELVQRSIPRQRFLDALADTVTIARGP